jgi:hypothetical protein
MEMDYNMFPKQQEREPDYSQVLELKQLSIDQTIYAFYEKVSFILQSNLVFFEEFKVILLVLPFSGLVD